MQETVAAAQAGDEEALRALLERYHDAVFRFGRRMCRSEADAQDVLQETLLTAMEKLDTYRGAASFSSWLYAIARSKCSRRHRHHARGAELAEDPVADDVAVDEAASRDELRALLHAALDQLEPKYREVLLLRDMEELSTPEVAAALELSVAAVKSRLHRARKMLRDRVEARLRQRPFAVAVAGQAPPQVLADLAELARGEISGESCARLEQSLDEGDAGLDRDEVLHLRQVLLACSACQEHRPSDEVRVQVQSKVREALQDYLKKV